MVINLMLNLYQSVKSKYGATNLIKPLMMKNFKTKNSIGLFTLVVALMVVGCKDKAAEKEVIVAPASTTETRIETTKVIEKEAPKADSSSTSVTVDSKGVKVDTKDVDVKIGN
jgi:hypothetical protein